MVKDVEVISQLMKISANSAPRAEGTEIEVEILDESEKEMVIEEMFQLADELNEESYREGGEMLESSEGLMIIGLNKKNTLKLDCRACGFESCDDLLNSECEGIFQGPNCAYRLIDMGIALGYAIKTAKLHNMDGKIMVRAGLAAKNLGLSDARVCMGVPIFSDLNEGYI